MGGWSYLADKPKKETAFFTGQQAKVGAASDGKHLSNFH